MGRVSPRRRAVSAARDHRRHRGSGRERRAAAARLRRARQHPPAREPRVRRPRRRLRPRRARPRGHVLLRGQHAPADGAARDPRALRQGRQAHDLVEHADAALPAQGARARAAPAAGTSHPRDRVPQRRRLRRQERSVQPRDLRCQDVDADGAARQDRADPRRGLLLPPRSAPGAHAEQDRGRQVGAHHRARLQELPRRRRLRQLRHGEHVLHGCFADRDLRGRELPLPRRALLHVQGAVRAQARARHAAAALRTRGAARQDRVRPRSRSGEDPARQPRAQGFADRQLPAHRLDGARRVHREGRRGVGLERAARQEGAHEGRLDQGPRPRVQQLPLRRRPADLLERHAALRRAAAARPQRARHRVLRQHRHRPGQRQRARLDHRRGARHRPARHQGRHGRHRPHARRPRQLQLACHGHDRQRRDAGRRARPRHHRPVRSQEARGCRPAVSSSPTRACSTRKNPRPA